MTNDEIGCVNSDGKETVTGRGLRVRIQDVVRLIRLGKVWRVGKTDQVSGLTVRKSHGLATVAT